MNKFALLPLLLTLSSAPAFAHAVVTPSLSSPGKSETYVLKIPVEKTVPTTSIRLTVPAGLTIELFQQLPDWKRELKTDTKGRITEVTWTGSLAPQEYQLFTFKARNPAKSTTLIWLVEQTYDDGSVVKWGGGPNAPEPASRTLITPKASGMKQQMMDHMHM